MSCQETENVLDQYALGTLDLVARGRVEQHLKKCARCRQQAQSYAEAMDLLPRALGSASPYRPPSSLKSELMSMAQASAEVRAHRMENAADRSDLSPSPSPARRGEKVRKLPLRLIFNRRFQLGSLVVSGAAIALLLVFSVLSNQQLEQARQDYAALQQQQQMALQVMNSSSTIQISLLPSAPNSPAYGKVLIRPDLETVVVLANHLPQPPLGRDYHLWVTTRGLQQLAGILNVNANGFGVLVFETNRKGPIFKAVELTLQPDHSGLPSGERVLAWQSRPNEMGDDLTFSLLGNRFVREDLNGPGIDAVASEQLARGQPFLEENRPSPLPKWSIRRANTD